MIHPGVQFKPVEGNPLLADWDSRQMGPNLRVETIPVHSQIKGGIAQAQQARKEARVPLCYCNFFASPTARIVTTGDCPERRSTMTNPALSKAWSPR